MSRKAFEKHYAEITGLNADSIKEGRHDSDCITTRGRNYQVSFLTWQACESEQAKLTQDLIDSTVSKIESLQAQNAELVEALTVAYAYCPDDESFDYIENLIAKKGE